MHSGREVGKKDDDEYELMPFQTIEKGAVIQETRCFSETPLDARRCCHMLTKLLFLIAQGERFTTNEATEVFFAVTKLFQSQDVVLRRLMYLVLKELTAMSESVIIVISSLSKDMNSTIDVYRANSIRVLCTILTDIAMLGQGERYIKQAIVDKDPYVSSSALISGYHLVHENPANLDVVKRWFNEVQDAAKSKYTMVQYHALGLLYKLRQHDRLAVSKLVVSMARSTVRSPYAHCLLIRLACRVMGDNEQIDRTLLDYLESCLRHKSDMVELEAARAMSNLPNITSKELASAVSALQLFLSSSKPTLRFAAVRVLNKLSTDHPAAVAACNLDMENLITDVNRSIATLAITTLLKTGSEASVDRLMKQIGSFMSEISDDFKKVVVDAIGTLCVKYPRKQRTLMTFLSDSLRDEGGQEYKKGIVEAIVKIVDTIPEAKEAGLSHLCEFIEDCEYPALSTRVLYVLGEKGPNTKCPSKFIRYIYNRLILENARVRASSVNALAKFGRRLPSLRPSVLVLLERCLQDTDDEVRDRATFHLSLLRKEDFDAGKAHDFVDDPIKQPLSNLEEALSGYLASGDCGSAPFDITQVSLEPPRAPPAKQKKDMGEVGKPMAKAAETVESYEEALAQVPEFAELGKLFMSAKPVELTESETEYTVNCVVHTFPQHFVLQFNCVNTLDDQQLSNVSVVLEGDSEELTVEAVVPLAVLPPLGSGAAYTVLKREDGVFPVATFQCTLRFTCAEADANTGEVDESTFDDDYNLEELEITAANYIQKKFAVDFGEKWDSLADHEMVERLSLSTMKSLQEAVDKIIEFLGMQAINQSDKVPAKAPKHILLLFGRFILDIPVLVRARMIAGQKGGVNMELAVRSTSDELNDLVMNTVVG